MSTLSVGTIKSNTSAPPVIQNTSGTEIGTYCRAWVNFNGSTATNPASMTGVRGSFNVSSVLDNGTGDQTVNFTTAMPDANYAAVAGGSTPGTRSNQVGTKYNQSASSCQIFTYSPTGTLVDATEISLAIFR